MKKLQPRNAFTILLVLFGLGAIARADVTFTDNFTSPINYLTNGIVGTIWDGIYLGADEITDATSAGAADGSVSVADANISGAGVLTIASLQTDWENAADDGVFLFKVITNNANFDVSVRIGTPLDTGAFNLPGLMVRAFGPGGSPAPGGQENSLLWARFDEFSIANMSKNNVNGAKTDTARGTFPNTNYWLRITRTGSTLRLFERPSAGAAWTLVGTVTRNDFNNLPLQVGIEHSDFAGGGTRIGRYAEFTLIVTNVGPYASTPSAATGLALSTNAPGELVASWTPGSGSVGSLVAVWANTNKTVKQAPANGLTYAANASYGSGDSLPGDTYFVVYSGPGSSVTVSNIPGGTIYNVAVFSFAGSGGSIAYSHTPAAGAINVQSPPPVQIVARAEVESPDVVISFNANKGKWYWLESTGVLNPPDWQRVGSEPVLANSQGMVVVDVGGALAQQRFYRLEQVDPEFALKATAAGITSIQKTGDAYPTEYIGGGKRLGDATIKYRQSGAAAWSTTRTVNGTGVASVTYSTNAAGTEYKARYLITNNLAGSLVFESVFTFQQDALLWTLNTTNLTIQSVDIGDLALPLLMNQAFSGITSSAMKHHHIAGHSSFVFWMRPNTIGPALLLTPDENTKLEYWDNRDGGVGGGGFEVFIHSYVAGTNSAAQNPTVTTGGDRWRMTNTTLTLAPNGSQTYGFKFQWADGYDAIRQALVDEGKLDIHVVPGMTLPTNLFAQFSLRTTQTVNSVTAEFPSQTLLQYLGANGSNQLYQVQFLRLGENKLTINYGNNRSTILEFFVTEPLETLVKKRATYLVNNQINDASKWYNGLYCDVNMNSGQLITPDNHDTLGNSFQVYEIASDDAGESRPAYMGVKAAAFPLQSEVTSLDNYIHYFVWNTLAPTGGLQRTTSETFSYGVYGVPEWHTLRSNNNLSIGRGYDYPHLIAMYEGMYRVAKYHPEVTTYLVATQYLQRAWGTAIALRSYGGGQATQIGLMNELVIADVIDELVAENMTNQAATLRTNWETKVNFYLSGNANLYGSEYPFDSTGFESQQAYAKYAMNHVSTMGATNPAAFTQRVRNFMNTQIAANVFDRGWLETSYYYYGSDYRGNMGNDYVVTYMSQEGGWGVLDYGLYYATNATDYLRLGYGSYLNGWSTMNTGTAASNYGFWYPGAAYDGGCGGGFEPSPYNSTWLAGQPMHRGAWYYSAEQNLGFCGAIRMAATILADDPIFGRFCYGGTWQQPSNIQVVPQDGVRRRFHALFGTNNLHLVIDTDRFAESQQISLATDLSSVIFYLETGNTSAHTAALHLTSSTAGTYTVVGIHGVITSVPLVAGQEVVINLPMDAGGAAQSFAISR